MSLDAPLYSYPLRFSRGGLPARVMYMYAAPGPPAQQEVLITNELAAKVRASARTCQLLTAVPRRARGRLVRDQPVPEPACRVACGVGYPPF